ncbi:choline ABC transporter ATP-binding protein [Aurantimonas sp. VKM B-3413]|uniref:choline ABC transporter ATP-binding protein n=1 Tax=Aurantimonas sp. VKM B-3413 TaxID=2779401 RepID=UPI001E4C6E32|nr:choline ABC transporter ATP-binding protein [Aurantimonas sp. VKM B-3413]MCB8837827.1 choline ABC transporter ATP-binding protein [Aurantimonas sp. VKM B-3413]
MTDPIVSFQNVSIVFGKNADKALPLADAGKSRAEIREETGATVGVTNASLDIRQGEIAVLMGLSGSGKSTLLRGVNGLAPITRGRVVVDTGKGAVDPKACGAKRLRDLRRHEVAMVFQQFALLPWRSVADNVGLGLELAGEPKSERRERVMTQLELVGLKDWADNRVGELSGGMQQRVGLARAFATDAPVLLMDEPFSALDPLIRSRLQDELLEFQQRLQKTIIFVSHDLDEAFKIGNRIAIMEGGRIVQVGTAQDIVLRPADDYVSDFVAHMNPLNVLTAEDVMKPLAGKDEAPARVAGMAEPDTPLRKVMSTVSKNGGSVVVSRKGQILGKIGPEDIVRALERHQAEG